MQFCLGHPVCIVKFTTVYQLKVAIVSDTAETKRDLELFVKVQRFDTLTDYFTEQRMVTLLQPFDVLEFEFNMKELLINGNCIETPLPNITINFNRCFITLWYVEI